MVEVCVWDKIKNGKCLMRVVGKNIDVGNKVSILMVCVKFRREGGVK